MVKKWITCQPSEVETQVPPLRHGSMKQDRAAVGDGLVISVVSAVSVTLGVSVVQSWSGSMLVHSQSGPELVTSNEAVGLTLSTRL